ncbi:MAG TPA: methylmalonyl Co-A mutase-associated GTPase MeaB [Jatrophihabitans sp.]|nr:methylmalonyl Co-A mutase-associated GTPase MeaB [Jatrophihabitans sp.]
MDLADLVARARDGQPRAVGRLISLIEDGSPRLAELSALLAPLPRTAHVVGLTGAPGVGKSTSTSALIGQLRKARQRVGVLAIDPSSPFTGGALLGDRIRMVEHAGDPGVFVRSMATRGQLGGMAAAAPQAVRVLEAAGCSVVLLETVGVGQSEVGVMRAADTTVVLLAPGMGDSVQAAKAGILEVADIFVVNKADRPEVSQVVRSLHDLQAMTGTGGWTPPILRTVATTGTGFADVVEAIHAHRQWLTGSGELQRRRVARARQEIEAIALAAYRDRLDGDATVARLAAAVAAGELDAYRAAAEVQPGT